MKSSAKLKPAIVYLVTNSVNGKRYIGVTTRTNLRRRESEHVCGARRCEHNGTFHRAIRKYGRDAFVWSILGRFENATQALAHEIKLVAELKPEYNSTRGGEYPPTPTAENIEKLRRLHKGNKYRLGMTHDERTRSLLSTLAKKQRQWEKWGNIGPMSVARKVVCLDDGQVFESASAAARHYGVAKSLLISVCGKSDRNVTAAGRVFRYLGDHLGGADEAQRIKDGVYARRRNEGTVNQVAVRCMGDGREFRSYQKAAEFYGLNPLDISCVCRGVRGRKTAGGLRFSMVEAAHATAS